MWIDVRTKKISRFAKVVLFTCALLVLLVQPSAAQEPSFNSPLFVRKTLAPPAKDVSELRFGDTFVSPVGPKGLELSSRAFELNGKRVRMVGFMVADEHTKAGAFMFAPMPVALAHGDESAADDLPPSTVFVHLALAPELQVPYLPGLLQLTGTLQLGASNEAKFDRVSMFRLSLDKRTTRELKKIEKKFRRKKSSLQHDIAMHR